MQGRFQTVLAHRRSFARAPQVAEGDIVERLRDDEGNPGWFWGVAHGGVEGFFPSGWFETGPEGTNARALRDYDATELTVDAGVEVTCIVRESGWLLVRTEDGQEGWVPCGCVARVD